MSTFFWSFKVLNKLIKFIWRQYNLCHIQTNSELSVCYISRSQFIEISEEFTNSDSLLLAELSYSCKNIINIFRFMLHNVNFNFSRLRSRVIIERLVIISSHPKHIFRSINLVAEIHVVDFIDVTLVHVSLQYQIQNIFRRIDAKLSQNSEELHFGDMAASSDIEILELWLQINSSVLNSCSILRNDIFKLLFLLCCTFKILSSCWECIVLGDWLNSSYGIFINTYLSECCINCSTEVKVIEHIVFGSVFVT